MQRRKRKDDQFLDLDYNEKSCFAGDPTDSDPGYEVKRNHHGLINKISDERAG